jgi:hypothetical protein
MKSAVLKTKLGREEEMQALKRLDSQARRLEATAEGPSFQSFVAADRGLPRARRQIRFRLGAGPVCKEDRRLLTTWPITAERPSESPYSPPFPADEADGGRPHHPQI